MGGQHLRRETLNYDVVKELGMEIETEKGKCIILSYSEYEEVVFEPRQTISLNLNPTVLDQLYKRCNNKDFSLFMRDVISKFKFLLPYGDKSLLKAATVSMPRSHIQDLDKRVGYFRSRCESIRVLLFIFLLEQQGKITVHREGR